MDATQLSVIFGFNACFGRPNRSEAMDTSNIEQLVDFTLQQYQSGAVTSHMFGFELGNEISWSIDGDAYARDFAAVQTLINTSWNEAGLGEHVPYMIGPDAEQTAQGWQWNAQILDTLDHISDGQVPTIQRALTYHHYPS